MLNSERFPIGAGDPISSPPVSKGSEFSAIMKHTVQHKAVGIMNMHDHLQCCHQY